MAKIIDPKVKQRCIEQMREHVHEYPNPTAAAEVIAKRNGVGQESVRRWFLQTRSTVASDRARRARSWQRSAS